MSIKKLTRELKRLEHENRVLFAFINREMKMTASDPRISELEKQLKNIP